MKGALEGDQPVAFRLAVRRMIFARGLDRAFHGLGAGIGEEDEIGECRLAQAFGEALGLRDAEEIGDVPGPLGGAFQRRDEMRMVMAERQHGDARAEIEIAVAVLRDEPSAFAAGEGEIGPRIGREKR